MNNEELHKFVLDELLDIRNLAEIGAGGLLDESVDSINFVTLFELVHKKAYSLTEKLDMVEASIVLNNTIPEKVTLVDVSKKFP